jgi:acetyl-CoA hydrolase
VVSQHDHIVAINSAIAVDLTGQVVSDSIGTRIYSGIGGQVDFVRGASRAAHGRPVIALPATARDGTVSRIVAELPRARASSLRAATCTMWRRNTVWRRFGDGHCASAPKR